MPALLFFCLACKASMPCFEMQVLIWAHMTERTRYVMLLPLTLACTSCGVSLAVRSCGCLTHAQRHCGHTRLPTVTAVSDFTCISSCYPTVTAVNDFISIISCYPTVTAVNDFTSHQHKLMLSYCYCCQ